VGIWVGVVGPLDWGEGIEKYSVEDEEMFMDMGGACGMLNLARRRVSEAWWDNFLSLPGSGDGPVAFEEPDPWLAGSAEELMSGLEAELSVALALLLLSNSIMPGNGNSFESIYFDRSVVE
jgi:hypothetical protein